LTRDQKLRFHLEMIVWQDLPEWTILSAAEIDDLVNKATRDQRRRAYQRALHHSPRLLPEEQVLTWTDALRSAREFVLPGFARSHRHLPWRTAVLAALCWLVIIGIGFGIYYCLSSWLG
jgi:hypothetical protein